MAVHARTRTANSAIADLIVTGAPGYVGRMALRGLSTMGDPVAAMARNARKAEENLPAGIQKRIADHDHGSSLKGPSRASPDFSSSRATAMLGTFCATMRTCLMQRRPPASTMSRLPASSKSMRHRPSNSRRSIETPNGGSQSLSWAGRYSDVASTRTFCSRNGLSPRWPRDGSYCRGTARIPPFPGPCGGGRGDGSCLAPVTAVTSSRSTR